MYNYLVKSIKSGLLKLSAVIVDINIFLNCLKALWRKLDGCLMRFLIEVQHTKRSLHKLQARL